MAMPAPGYYKTSCRTLRLRETVGRYGLLRGLKSYWKTRFLGSAGGTWMPALWAETECRSEDLSEEFRLATKPHQKNFEEMGFKPVRFFKSKTLQSTIQDNGGITYLDATGRHVGSLHFIRVFRRSSRRFVNEIFISFSAALESGTLSCTNQKRLFDPAAGSQVVHVSSYNAKVVYEKFLEALRSHKDPPRRFPDVESLRQWFDQRQMKAFEERVRRGLFVLMTEQEVAAAKARLTAGAVTASRVPGSFRWAIILAVIGCICLFQFIHNPELRRGGDTIRYQGQEFKMSRPYADYEEYKDDPNNLDTNELDRIEQVMVSFKVPESFKNNREFIHLLFALKFPGYGMGGTGDNPKTDDGSMLLVESVEIPRRNKDRVLTARQSGEELKIIDDFVYSTATNQIQHVNLENKVLRYYDAENRLIREKPL